MLTDHLHDQLGKHRIGVISDLMPSFIKEAEEKIVTDDLSKLADGAFAYSDGINRFFPIHNAEHTWMSHAYFEKFASQIPEQERDEVRARIQDAYEAFELPKENVVKIAEEASKEDEIDSLHSLIIEMEKFIGNYKRLHIDARRKAAKVLLSKAYALGRQSNVHDLIKRYAGDGLNPNYAAAFAKRMTYFKDGSPERSILMDMQHETPNTKAEKAAQALHVFDRNTKLDNLYDNELDDPYASLLHPHVPEEFLDFDGHKLLPSQIKNFDYSSLADILSEALSESFKTDPINALHTAKPHIKMIVIRKIRG